jgi:hypothetical protein
LLFEFATIPGVLPMARRKKISRILTKSEVRLLGIKSIDSQLDLGNGMSATVYEQEIVSLRQQIADYNTMLAKADAASNEIIEAEKRVSDLTGRMLSGIAMRYGRSSNEYEMAGGVRREDRRRRRVSQPEALPMIEAATS